MWYVNIDFTQDTYQNKNDDKKEKGEVEQRI